MSEMHCPDTNSDQNQEEVVTTQALISTEIPLDENDSEVSQTSHSLGEVEDEIMVDFNTSRNLHETSRNPSLLSDSDNEDYESEKEEDELRLFVESRAMAHQYTLETDEKDLDRDLAEDGVSDSGSLRSSSISDKDEALTTENLAMDIEADRQQTLREMAEYDRIGRKHLPVPETPFELISKLQKRKEHLTKWAKSLREPFEKFQDFDSFIDDITITNDQSWENVEVIMNEEADDELDEYMEYKQDVKIPNELPLLLKNLTREILRQQPQNINQFCEHYFSELISQRRS